MPKRRKRKPRQHVRVVVESDKIQGSFGLWHVLEPHSTALDSTSPCPVPKPFQKTSKGPINRTPTVLRVKQCDVLRKADGNVWIFFLEGAVNTAVSKKKVAHDSKGERNGTPSGRKHTQGVAHGGKHGRLVDGDPRGDPVGQRLENAFTISHKRGKVRSVSKSPLRFPPVGMREVMQRDHRTNAPRQKVVHHR